MKIEIFTDGAVSGNPGKGGYGIILISGIYRREISQGFRLTTNNRMELLSVIVALEALKVQEAQIIIYSDSQYVVDAVNKNWIYSWLKKRFKNVKNRDLWSRIIPLLQKFKPIFIWVKGHASNFENNNADSLAIAASKQQNLLIDDWYEANVECENLKM